MATSGNFLKACKYYSFFLPPSLLFSPVPFPLLLPPSLLFLPPSPAALSALISDIECYWSSVAELEAWLGAGEARMEECGPIGANLPRLVEQSPILEVGTAVDRLPMVTPSQHHTITPSHHPSLLQYHTITSLQPTHVR